VLVDPQSAPEHALPGAQPEEVEESFRQALLRSHRSREFLGEVEAAAAHFCRALRQRGVAPERMLIDAKRVIEQTIDGNDVLLAERAVESCIRHYYRVD
jgi:RNA:NAD 2'-phosphotransferase (TPT1/KptA family)